MLGLDKRGPRVQPEDEQRHTLGGVKMKLGKMLSVGEVVEDCVPEATTVAEPAPVSTAADSVTEGADSAPAPDPVVVRVDG